MNKKNISLSRPHFGINELEFISNSIKDDQSTFINDYVSGFENDLESYLNDDKKIVALNSATSAIHLALILSDVRTNDEVIIQSATYAASAFPIRYLNANPIFIDSEKDTWNMCPLLLEKAIEDRLKKGVKPKAIIVVHLYGMPAKMDEIIKVAKKHEIIVIEDAAEAFGSVYKGKKCGTFGDFGILSFNINKILTTFGGGALICKNQEVKQKAIFLATQARDNTQYYQHTEIGYNYKMSNVLAGIGRGQMKALDTNVNLRRSNNNSYQEFFKDIDGFKVFKEFSLDYFSNHWLSCVLIDAKITGFTNEELRFQLEKDNIESRLLWKPMHLQPVFKDCLYFGATISEMLFEKGLCLPSGSNLTDNDIDRIKSSIRKLL